MTKILITGGLGFLGQHVAKPLLEAYPDSDVMILARSNSEKLFSELKNSRVRTIANIRPLRLNRGN